MYDCSVLKACEELRMSIQCLHRSHWAPPRGSSRAGRFRFAWLCVFLSLYIWSFRAFFLWIFAPGLSIGFLCICCSCFFPCFLSLPTTLPITLGFAFRSLGPQTNATTQKNQANICPIHAKQKSKISGKHRLEAVEKSFKNHVLIGNSPSPSSGAGTLHSIKLKLFDSGQEIVMVTTMTKCKNVSDK